MTKKTEPRIVDAEPEDMSDGAAEERAATGPHIVAVEPEGFPERPVEESDANTAATDLDEDERALRALPWTFPAAMSQYRMGS